MLREVRKDVRKMLDLTQKPDIKISIEAESKIDRMELLLGRVSVQHGFRFESLACLLASCNKLTETVKEQKLAKEKSVVKETVVEKPIVKDDSANDAGTTVPVVEDDPTDLTGLADLADYEEPEEVTDLSTVL